MILFYGRPVLFCYCLICDSTILLWFNWRKRSHDQAFRQSISCRKHQTMKNMFCWLVTVVLLTGSSSSAQQSNPYIPASKSEALVHPLHGHPSLFHLGLGGGDFLPENSIPALGTRQQLIRRFHYLQYIKEIYKQLKEDYTRYFQIFHRNEVQPLLWINIKP